MNKNQKGFSVVEILIGAVVIGLIGATGWYVWQNQQKNNTKSNASETVTTNKKSIPDEKAKTDTTITGVSISLTTESDISKLPAVTPASFKAYMLEKLKNNKPDADGCASTYNISKISVVNIKGGEAPTKDDLSCGSGAPMIWVLAPSGKWDQESLNGAVCKSEGGGLVYEEFASECYTDPNTDSLVKNPNGSIKALAQSP